LHYPIVPAIRSILEICDEVVVNVGKSDDATRDLVAGLGDPRVRILDTVWDFSRGSSVLAQETERAMRACRGAWGLYIQADEVLHETGAAILRDSGAARPGAASSGPPCCDDSTAHTRGWPRSGSPRGAIRPRVTPWPRSDSDSGICGCTRRTGSSTSPGPASSNTATTSSYDGASLHGIARDAGGGVQSALPPQRPRARPRPRRGGVRGTAVRGAAARPERRVAPAARRPTGRAARARTGGRRARVQG